MQNIKRDSEPKDRYLSEKCCEFVKLWVQFLQGSAMMRKEVAGSPGGTEVTLDAADCLTLQRILQAFNSNISEEHAWALFYQASRCFQKCLDEGNAYYLPTELGHVLLHKDGIVHPSTLLHTGGEYI